MVDSSFCQSTLSFSSDGTLADELLPVWPKHAASKTTTQIKYFGEIVRPISLAAGDRFTAEDSAIYFRLPELLDSGFGTDGRVVHLFERIRAGLGGNDRHDLDMPMVVLVNGLPITERLRGMQAVGRGVQREMETLRDGANSLQRSAQQGGKIGAQSRFR